MNTRLQVEHPVTEQITGLDLVAMQIDVARGRPLGLTQDDVTLQGHAIEARLCAEDPIQNFQPASGPIERWRPVSRDGVRIDAGIAEGQVLSSFYDSMIAKVIGYGPTRDIALDRLQSALRDIVVVGPPTNAEFLIACCEKDSFRQGRATTAFIAEEFGPGGFHIDPPVARDWAAAAAILTFEEHRSLHARAGFVPPPLLGWTSGRDLSRSLVVMAGAETKPVVVRQTGPAQLSATVDGAATICSSTAIASMAPRWTFASVKGRLKSTASEFRPAMSARTTRLRSAIKAGCGAMSASFPATERSAPAPGRFTRR